MNNFNFEYNERSIYFIKNVIISLIRSYLIKTRKLYSFDINLSIENENLKDNYNLDSLDLLNITMEINIFFNIHKLGIEDKLLVKPTLENWSEIAIKSLQKNGGYLTFSTSGTTGTPKLVTHTLGSIFNEAKEISLIVGNFNKILTLVPLHHIYGFLYSVVLPYIKEKTSVFISSLKMLDLEDNLLIVATPEQWKTYKDLIILSKKKIKGISSTGPLDSNLFAELIKNNIQLYEFFGSTETLGLGFRTLPEEKFRFFSYLTVKNERIFNIAKEEYLETMDNLRIENNRFEFMARKDNAVSIGGTNVFPDYVRLELLKNDLVIDCSVRSYNTEFGLFLKALIVPKSFDESITNKIKEYISKNDSTKYIKNIKFAEKIPINEVGKPSDWEI